MWMPLFKNIYVKEVQNRMYWPSAYFLSVLIATSINLVMYPLIVSSITFFFIGFEDDSFVQWLKWFEMLSVLGIGASCFGFMFGCILDDI